MLNRVFSCLLLAVATIALGGAVAGTPRDPARATPPATATLNALAVSADGRTIVGGGKDGVVWIWDIARAGPPQTLSASGEVLSVALAPDGRRLAAGCADGQVHLWQAARGGFRPVGVWRCRGAVQSLVFSPDGHTLACGTWGGGTIHLFDATTGRPRRSLWEASNGISALAFTPDGRGLVSGGVDVKLWDVRPATLRSVGAEGTDLKADQPGALMWERWKRPGPGDMPYIAGIAVSPDGRLVAATSGIGGQNSGGKTLTLWDAATGRLRRTLRGQGLTAVTFSRDGRWIAAGSDSGRIWLWSAATGALARQWQAQAGAVWAVVFLPGRPTLATAGQGGVVRLWDAGAGAPEKALPTH